MMTAIFLLLALIFAIASDGALTDRRQESAHTAALVGLIVSTAMAVTATWLMVAGI